MPAPGDEAVFSSLHLPEFKSAGAKIAWWAFCCAASLAAAEDSF